MRKYLLLAVCAGGMAIAAPVCTTNTNVLSTVNGQPYSCEVNGLTFSDFSLTTSGNVDYSPIMDITGFGINSFGEVYLTFNPNMSVKAGSTTPPGGSAPVANHLDAYFYFTVTASQSIGGITGIDLGNTGVNTAITETACSSPINRASNGCGANTIGQLAAVNTGSTFSDSHVFMTFTKSASPIYIFKDIDLVATATQGAALSSFSQSFAIPGGKAGPGGEEVPEPDTFLTLGGGLILSALVLRRKLRTTA